MVMITSLSLQISEIQGVASATVQYEIQPSQMDVWTQQRYSEFVELIGADRSVGEVGLDTALAGGIVARTGFTSLSTEPMQRNFNVQLPSTALDEDANVPVPQTDEVAARVTLTPFTPVPIRGTSNVVVRGGTFAPS